MGWFYTGSRIVSSAVDGKNNLAKNKKLVLGIPAYNSAGIQKRVGPVQCKQRRETKQLSSCRDSLLVCSSPSSLRAKK